MFHAIYYVFNISEDTYYAFSLLSIKPACFKRPVLATVVSRQWHPTHQSMMNATKQNLRLKYDNQIIKTTAIPHNF